MQHNSFLSNILNRPLLSAPIIIYVLFALRYLVTRILVFLMPASMSPVVESELLYWCFTAIFLGIWFFYLSKMKNLLPKSPLFGGTGMSNPLKLLILYLPALLYAAYFAFGKALNENGAWSWNAPWFFYAASIAISAGVVEEILCRGIPMGNAMRNLHTRSQTIALLVITSVAFGSLHIFNVLDGSNLALVLCQALHATGMGFFFGAVYLRTGSVLPSMVIHALHDFILFYAPYASLEETAASPLMNGSVLTGQALGIITGFTVMWILISLFMLRKSKWEQIKENFQIR